MNRSRLAAVILTATTMFATMTSVSATSNSSRYLLGDVNGDGVITPNDAQMALQYYVEVLDSLPNIDAADFNRDGEITPSDAQAILMAYVYESEEIWVDPNPDTETPEIPGEPTPPPDDDTPIELPELP